MFFKRKHAVAEKAGKKAEKKVKPPSSDGSAPVAKDVIRFGIGAKLQLAFGVAAVMTVVAAAVAIFSFSATEKGFQHVASNEVPAMTDALRLSAISGEISTAAARLVNARTEKEQQAISSVMAGRNHDFLKVMSRLRAAYGSDGKFAKVEGTVQKLDANLGALKVAILDRTEAHAKLEQQLASFHKLHHAISGMLTPLVDDSYFDVATAADNVGKTGDRIVRSIIDGDLPVLRALVEIGSETNLQTGLLTAGALTSSPSIQAMLDDRIASSVMHVKRLLDKLPNTGEFAKLKGQVADLLKLANVKTQPASAGQATAVDQGNPEQLKKLFRIQESLGNVLVTMVDDLNFKVVIRGEAAAKRTGKLVEALVNRQISGLRDTL